PPGGAGRAAQGDRQEHRGSHSVRFGLRFRGSGGRAVRPVRAGARPGGDRGRHGWPGRADRAAYRAHRPPRALAHPLRAQDHLREERRLMAVPYRFEPTTTVGAIRAQYGSLAPDDETGVEVTVAGRLMLRRPTGQIAFGQLRDSTGTIQLFCGAGWTDDFDG